jgi:geranylgeranyl pyrophosphate synthase
MKDLAYLNKKLEQHLEEHLEPHGLSEVLRYAVLPPGKLFRSQLVYALSHDLSSHTEAHELLASSIEIHHSYTLIHDDLPAMDDDDMRRGKQATHKKFGEWKAILAGDALLAMSFGLLANIKHENLNKLLALYHQLTGTNGLILGQFLDLENQTSSIESIIEVHTLKTARLIQLSLMGSNLLSSAQIEQEDCSTLGLSIGIIFQLIDDLTELAEDLSQHEKEINPFLRFNQEEICTIIENEFNKMNGIFEKQNLPELESIIKNYLLKMNLKISSGENAIKKFLPEITMNRLKNLIG